MRDSSLLDEQKMQIKNFAKICQKNLQKMSRFFSKKKYLTKFGLLFTYALSIFNSTESSDQNKQHFKKYCFEKYTCRF